MTKKAIFFILGLGLLVAVGLGVVFYIKNNELKTYLQTSLNENFEKFTEGYIKTWEPFECDGFMKIRCISKKMTTSTLEDFDKRLNIAFNDVTLDFEGMSDSNLEIIAKIKNVEFSTQTQQDTTQNINEYIQILNDIQPFLPSSAECFYAFNKQNKQLLSSSKCQINTPNAHYELDGSNIYENANFSELNVAQIIHSFYTKLSPDQDLSELENTLYALKDASIQITNNGLSESAFEIYKKYMANEDKPTDNEEHKAVSKKDYLASLQNLKPFFTLFTDIVGEEHLETLSKLGDEFIALLSGEKKTLSFSLNYKPENKLELQPILKIEENFLNKDFWKNYQLSVSSK